MSEESRMSDGGALPSNRRVTEHDTPEPVVAIVVAAGSGVRLGNSSAGGHGPKALRKLSGVPLLRHSIDRLIAGGVDRVVVVSRPEFRKQMRATLAGIDLPITFTDGGATRTDSVRNGLRVLEGVPPVVLVHDAARPLVPAEVVSRVIAAVRGGSSTVIPVISLIDSVRAVEPHGSRVVDRSGLRAVQTPQGFDGATLIDAYDHLPADTLFTDDASVCEAQGSEVALVEGSVLSMKITRPHDFLFAEALLQAGLA